MLLKYTDKIGRLSLLNANYSPGATPFITFPNSSPPSLYPHGWRLGRDHFALCNAPPPDPLHCVHYPSRMDHKGIPHTWSKCQSPEGISQVLASILLRDPRDWNFSGEGSFHGNKALHSLTCVWTTEISTAEKQRPDRSTRGGEIKKIGRSPE